MATQEEAQESYVSLPVYWEYKIRSPRLWLEYSKRESCEVCGHSFKFHPIYAPGTPKVLPLPVLISALFERGAKCVLRWLHYVLVVFAWLVVVPLVACRIYRALFTASISSILTLPVDILSMDRIFQDFLQGLTLVVSALATFLGYVWLREMVMFNGGPQWLNIVVDVDPEPHEPEIPVLPNEDVLFPIIVAGAEQEVLPEDFRPAPRPPPLRDLPQPPRPQNQNAGNNHAAQEQALEAVNWDRLLGLDGSFAFIEHVLWLIALNTLFILIFAFCPFHLGHFTITGLRMEKLIEATKIANIVTTFVGYVILTSMLMLGHLALKFAGLYQAGRLFGLCYIYLKIALIYVIELAILPILSGMWIDACSLKMLNVTIHERVQFFYYSPLAFFCFNWIKGMLYTFYLTSLILACKGIVRPGLLVFVHNLSGPDFKLIRWLIMYPLPVYVQKLVSGYCLTGILIVFTLWVPSMIMRKLMPGFLPFHLNSAFEEPFDYTVELTFGLMTFFFYSDEQLKKCLTSLIRYWGKFVSWCLDLRSYLMGDVEFQPGDVIVGADGRETTAAASGPGSEQSTAQQIPRPAAAPEAEEDADGVTFSPYRKPTYFKLRLVGLVLMFSITWIILCCLLIIVPLKVGRNFRQLLMQTRFRESLIKAGSTAHLLLDDNKKDVPSAPQRASSRTNDVLLYIIGLYLLYLFFAFCFFVKRVVLFFRTWSHRNLTEVLRQYRRSCYIFMNQMSNFGRNVIHWMKPSNRAHAVSTTLSSTVPVLTYPTLVPSPNMSESSRFEQEDMELEIIQNEELDLIPIENLQSRTSLYSRIHALWSSIFTPIGKLSHFLLCAYNKTSFVFCYVAVIFLLLIVMPIMTGLLVELTLLTPFRIDPRKSINLDFIESWLFGVKLLHVILFLVLTLGQQQWRMQGRLEMVIDEIVIRGVRARVIQVIWPVFAPWISGMGLALTLPYLTTEYLSVYFGWETSSMFRYGYFLQSALVFSVILLMKQLSRWVSLYQTIKNERYMVGRILVNLDRSSGALQLQRSLESDQ
ncbi:E3 ubiquitin-protein ligase march6 [Cichlidogyrus casuarinus]|uniref:RING-type E3 ubiquitin transferase n=1 Tax=Cichlidogyrus casuarinus TaxID=1844966 RepID=A0ABD2QNG1_9PLAT